MTAQPQMFYRCWGGYGLSMVMLGLLRHVVTLSSTSFKTRYLNVYHRTLSSFMATSLKPLTSLRWTTSSASLSKASLSAAKEILYQC